MPYTKDTKRDHDVDNHPYTLLNQGLLEALVTESMSFFLAGRWKMARKKKRIHVLADRRSEARVAHPAALRRQLPLRQRLGRPQRSRAAGKLRQSMTVDDRDPA